MLFDMALSRYRTRLRPAVFALTFTVGGCSFLFAPPDPFDAFNFPWPDGTPLLTASRSGVDVVYEDAGVLAVLHGFSCASSDRDGQEDFVRIQERLNLAELLEEDPRWITDATVFLNGFQSKFLNEEHTLLGFAVAVARIEHVRTELNFEGGGALSSHDFKDPYELCYTYTALIWNRQELPLSADHGDPDNVFILRAEDNHSVTSLNVLRNYREGLGFIGLDTPAGVLPRGAGMAWTSGEQLLQASYSLGSGATVLDGGRSYATLPSPQGLTPTTQRQGAGGISWDSSVIFKPNDRKDDVYAAELVSVLGGEGLSLLQPPFLIEPANEKEPCGGWFTGCIGNPPDVNGPMTEEVVIENLPYEMAVPVLSGWSLGYVNDDHSIRDLGVSIDRFSYEPPSGGAPGTLRYTVTAVADNDGNFMPALRHRVSVLGLTPPPSAPDPGAPVQPQPVDPPGPVTDE